MTFPSNPDVGTVYPEDPQDIADSGGRKWEFDGDKWNLMTNPVSDVTFIGESPIVVDDQSLVTSDGTILPSVTTSFDISQLPKLS